MGKKIATTLVLLLVGWSLKFGWNLVTLQRSDFPDGGSTEWIAEENQWVSEEIASGGAANANGWLDRSDHATFEADPAQMRRLIDQFQQGGAERVWVVGIEAFGNSKLSDTIAVKLPPSGPARDRVFAIERELGGGDGTADVDQEYLVVSFD